METMQGHARALAEQIDGIGEFDVASQLAAERGWMVPAYTLPPNADHTGC
jgi:hypothetical protein